MALCSTLRSSHSVTSLQQVCRRN